MVARLSLNRVIALAVAGVLSLVAPATHAYQSPGPDLGTACAWEGADPSRAGFFATCVGSIVVARPLQVGDQSAACAAGTAGQIKYSSGALSYCNGSAWTSIGGAASSQWSDGASSAIYYNSGNIGIGTTSPGSKLTVSGSIKTSGGDFQFIDVGTIDSTAVRLFSNSGNLYLQNGSGDNIFFRNKSASITMTITNTGNVGIGTTSPSQLLHVNGTAYATTFLHTSDRRLKKEITEINDPAGLVARLAGVHFRWRKNDVASYGVIAQDVRAVLPDAVTVTDDGTMAVDYDQLIPVLLEAVKAQDRRIKALEAEIGAVQHR